MVKINERKVLGSDGRELAVQLDIKEYRIIEDYIEDLEDSLELAKAIKEAKGFRLWEEFVAELKTA